jgi:hypothetical protein
MRLWILFCVCLMVYDNVYKCMIFVLFEFYSNHVIIIIYYIVWSCLWFSRIDPTQFCKVLINMCQANKGYGLHAKSLSHQRGIEKGKRRMSFSFFWVPFHCFENFRCYMVALVLLCIIKSPNLYWAGKKAKSWISQAQGKSVVMRGRIGLQCQSRQCKLYII